MSSGTLGRVQRGVALALRRASSKPLTIQIPTVLVQQHFPLSTKTTKKHFHLEVSNPKIQEPLPSKSEIEVVQIEMGDRNLKLNYADGSVGSAAFLWLRDNCQCSLCFDSIALGRKYILMDLNLNAKIKSIKYQDKVVTITWDDGHISPYGASWLHERSFTPQSRQVYRNKHHLEREPWGKGLTLNLSDYATMRSNDPSMLQWLMTLERKGVALIKNSPNDPDAGASLIDQVAFVKQTHYGRRSPVMIRENSNNVAFSNLKLGLHNDLPQYEQQPGIILIQTVKQHEGNGGESVISDGLFCSEILRRRHPLAYQILSKTNVYFWDKGTANFDMEMDEFYKITKYPIIGLDAEGNLDILRVNNQIRDSHLDLPGDEVNGFYEAMKLFNDILYENSYTFKMENGAFMDARGMNLAATDTWNRPISIGTKLDAKGVVFRNGAFPRIFLKNSKD